MPLYMGVCAGALMEPPFGYSILYGSTNVVCKHYKWLERDPRAIACVLTGRIFAQLLLAEELPLVLSRARSARKLVRCSERVRAKRARVPRVPRWVLGRTEVWRRLRDTQAG